MMSLFPVSPASAFCFHAGKEESGIKDVVLLCQEARALCTAPFAGTLLQVEIQS